MKNFKKLLAVALAAVTAMSVMGITAMAEVTSTGRNPDKIDYSIYDSDMIWVQEDADMIAQLNEQLKESATILPTWNWSDGIFSVTSSSAAMFVNMPVFVPKYNYLYLNVEVVGAIAQPELVVGTYDAGVINYYGTYPITETSTEGTYRFSNYKRALTAGKSYYLNVMSTKSNWRYANMDVYYESFD